MSDETYNGWTGDSREHAERLARRRERGMMTAYAVRYRGFLQSVSRMFSTRERAEQWCRQIGRPDLIRTIVEVRT